MGASIGDRHDTAIRSLLGDGLCCGTVGQRLGVSGNWVNVRANRLGLNAIVRANARLAWVRGGRQTVGRNGRSAFALGFLKGRRDDAASRLVRSVRYHRPDGSACIDPEHVVACLHARGVTLPEIDQHLGVPPIEAVAAIRKFAEARP